MPSQLHEALLSLFRNRPQLAAELLRDALHVPLPQCTQVRIESAELTDVQPAEYRADLVVLLYNGKPVLGIVVEVQLRADERKRFVWPMYVVGLRAPRVSGAVSACARSHQRPRDGAADSAGRGGGDRGAGCRTVGFVL
jgi:hypothetical protein